MTHSGLLNRFNGICDHCEFVANPCLTANDWVAIRFVAVGFVHEHQKNISKFSLENILQVRRKADFNHPGFIQRLPHMTHAPRGWVDFASELGKLHCIKAAGPILQQPLYIARLCYQPANLAMEISSRT